MTRPDTARRRWRRRQLRERGICPSSVSLYTRGNARLTLNCVRYGWAHELHRAIVRRSWSGFLSLTAGTVLTWGTPGSGRL